MVLPQTVHFFLPSYIACGILVPNWGLGPAVEAEPPAGRRGAPSAVVLRGSASVHGGVRGAGTRVSFPQHPRRVLTAVRTHCTAERREASPPAASLPGKVWERLPPCLLDTQRSAGRGEDQGPTLVVYSRHSLLGAHVWEIPRRLRRGLWVWVHSRKPQSPWGRW